jgi:GxxExxY protein
MVDLLYKEECYKIIGLCMKIHSKLGKGFKEVVYQDALEVELKKDGTIEYKREKLFKIVYEDVILPHYFKADFFVFNSIIIETKAATQIHADAFKQTLNYLKTSQVKLGIIINFGADKLEFKRVLCTY